LKAERIAGPLLHPLQLWRADGRKAGKRSEWDRPQNAWSFELMHW
jgi:hypothetical protein